MVMMLRGLFLALLSCAAARGQAPAPAAVRPVRAFVYEHSDKWTKSARAAELLRAAGCEVAALPLDTVRVAGV